MNNLAGAGSSQLLEQDYGSAERNLILDALSPHDRARLAPKLERVPMPTDMVVYEANTPITEVYFPVSGIVSMVSSMREGTVEIGTVGREGMTGIAVVLQADSMPTRAFVQVEGAALRIDAEALRTAMRESAALDRMLHRSALAMYDQAAQSAACNRLHSLEARCARWLLMTHDRVDSDVLPLKQKFLAEMLGVHRPAVTVAAGMLQRAGIIQYTRGKLRIVDRPALERAACDCYDAMRRNFAELRTLE